MIFHKRDRELIILWWWQIAGEKVKGKMKIMNPSYGGEKEADTGPWIDCEDLCHRI